MKPKVAFFDFTGCEGCQLQVISLGEELLRVLGLIEVVNFREAISEKRDDYEIAIIDGALSTEEDIRRIKAIRQQADILITIGACACLGGINCLKNFYSKEAVLGGVYGRQAHYFDTIPARPIWAEVPVEYQVRGCPIDQGEFLRIITAVLTGQQPVIPNYPVCMECRSRENVCMYDKGQTCLGPVTRAGCGAICPSYGNFCWGCRGLVDDPNETSEKELLKKHGLSLEQILKAFRMSCGFMEIAKGA
jgi:coenzyme F420-reducing hydrogenase gamma subunit